MKSRFLILGSEGFLGQAIKNGLEENGHQIFSIDICGNPSLKINIIENIDLLEQTIDDFIPDYIINFAAFSNGSSCAANPEKVYGLNVLFVEKVALLCQRKKVKAFFQASSEWIYGPGPIVENYTKLADSYYHRDLDLYSRSKLDSELCLMRCALNGTTSNTTKLICYRFGIIYGNSLFASNCVVDFLLGKWDMSHELNVRTPMSARSFVSLDDIIDIFVESEKIVNQCTDPFSVYDIQGSHSYDLQSIINYIEKKSMRLVPISIYSILDKSFDRKFVTSDIHKLLKQEPRSLQDYLDLRTISK